MIAKLGEISHYQLIHVLLTYVRKNRLQQQVEQNKNNTYVHSHEATVKCGPPRYTVCVQAVDHYGRCIT